MQVELNLQNAKIEKATIKFRGDETTVLVTFVAPIGVEGVRALGDGVYSSLFRNGAGDMPRLNPFKTHDPGVSIPNAVLTLERYPGANPEALEGSIKAFQFRDADGHAIVDIKARFRAEQELFNFLLNQKQDPMPSMTITGELRGGEVQGELDLGTEQEPVAGAEPKKRGRKPKA